jgi:hypothetical protein
MTNTLLDDLKNQLCKARGLDIIDHVTPGKGIIYHFTRNGRTISTITLWDKSDKNLKHQSSMVVYEFEKDHADYPFVEGVYDPHNQL